MTEYTRKAIYVDGDWLPVEESMEDISPLDGTVFASVPNASAAHIDKALTAAREAFDSGPWPRMTREERARALETLADAIDNNYEKYVDLSVAEWGQTNDEGTQIGRASGVFRAAAQAVRDNEDLRVTGPASDGSISYVPHGVVSAITPWNYPFHLNIVKVAYALGAGNTVVLKPSPLTPLAGLIIAETVHDADVLPPGVLNVVTTDSVDLSAMLTSDPRVDMVTFTGSTPVGKAIMKASADTMKRLVLELGGKSASIVLPDADLAAATRHAAYEGCTRHAGQVCALYGRLLVPRAQHDDIVEQLVAKVRSTRVGDRRFEDVQMGPLISNEHRNSVTNAIDKAVAEGAVVATGGHAIDRPGFYVEPTVLTGIDPSMAIADEEVFGPVLAVIPYDSVEDAVQIANGTPYGLGGSVWGGDVIAATEVGKKLRVGQVSVNGVPALGSFGGHKMSVIGREHGLLGLRGYGEPVAVSAPKGEGALE